MQCVAIDPTEQRIAAGDVSGRILIWNAFKEKVPKLHKSKPQTTPATAAASAPTARADAVMQAAGKSSETDLDCDSDSSDSEQQTAAEQPAQTAVPTIDASQDASNDQAAKPSQPSAASSRRVVQSQAPPDVRFGRMQNSIEQVPLTTVHWHAHPVGTVCFSADGTLLLSGGQEAVMVAASLNAHTVSRPFASSRLLCSSGISSDFTRVFSMSVWSVGMNVLVQQPLDLAAAECRVQASLE